MIDSGRKEILFLSQAAILKFKRLSVILSGSFVVTQVARNSA